MKIFNLKKILYSMALVIACAFIYSFTYVPDQEAWVVPPKYKSMKNPTDSKDAEGKSVGKNLYMQHCKSCHGKTGLGDGPKAAELDTPSGDFSSEEVQSQTDGEIFYKSKEGRDDMPGFSKKIPDDEDIWLIVNFMRTLKG